MKPLQKFCYLVILTIVLSSAFCAEGDNPPPVTESPIFVLSTDDAPVPLAYLFIKVINPPDESVPNHYSVSLDLSKIYGEETKEAYQLNVGDKLTVKVDFEAYPHSNFMQVVTHYGYTPVFVNRELEGSSRWRMKWSERNPGTWGGALVI